MEKRKAGWLRRFFWDAAKANENWAQTLARVLGNLFRTSAAIFIMLGAFAVAVAVSSYEMNRRAEASDPANFITANVSFGSKDCPEDRRWNVRVTNKSKEVLSYAEFKLSIREKGSSRYLFLNKDHSTLIVQRFVPPDYGYQFCTDAFNRPAVGAMRREPEGVTFSDYEIELSLEPFSARFRDPEPWIVQETLQAGGLGSVMPLKDFESISTQIILASGASKPQPENEDSAAVEFASKVTEHGISFEIPKSWKEVSTDAFNSEIGKVANVLPALSQEYLKEAELIFAIGLKEGALADVVLIMRVASLSPEEALTQDDLKSLTTTERSIFLESVRSSALLVKQQQTPGLDIVNLAGVTIKDTGHLLCVEQNYDTLRPDRVEASYINWSCPIGAFDINLSAHVRKDRASEFLPTIERVLGSLDYRE